MAARCVAEESEGSEELQRCSQVAGRTRPTGVADAVGAWGGRSWLVTGGGWLPSHLAANLCRDCSACCAGTTLVEFIAEP